MKNILVTGGAGFIGSHLVETLLERGDRVSVVESFFGPDPESVNVLSSRLILSGVDFSGFIVRPLSHCRVASRFYQESFLESPAHSVLSRRPALISY